MIATCSHICMCMLSVWCLFFPPSQCVPHAHVQMKLFEKSAKCRTRLNVSSAIGSEEASFRLRRFCVNMSQITNSFQFTIKMLSLCRSKAISSTRPVHRTLCFPLMEVSSSASIPCHGRISPFSYYYSYWCCYVRPYHFHWNVSCVWLLDGEMEWNNISLIRTLDWYRRVHLMRSENLN